MLLFKTVRNVLVLVVVAVAPSAAVAAEPATIPLGVWKGAGTYVEFSRKPEAGKQPQTSQDDYETSLRITHQKLFGEEALVMDIVSEGGLVLGMQTRRVQAALVKLRSLEDGSTLYAVANVKFDERARWDESAFRKGADQATVVCRHRDDGVAVTVHYAVPSQDEPTTFYDRIEFSGKQVRKHGSYLRVQESGRPSEEFVAVYWDEQLRPSSVARSSSTSASKAGF